MLPRDFHNIFARDLNQGGAINIGVSIGATSTPVLTPNRERRRAVFINDSDEAIYLCKGELAVMNTGIRLATPGGSWEETPDSLGYLWRGAWSAICTSGSKNLCVIEEF